MPGQYQQFTLDAIASQIAILLDDANELFWTRQEKYYAIWEALRVWGALTSYWRTRGTFNLNPSPTASPYYDLSLLLPTLRTRNWTLGQMVAEIQYMLLEAPNGISGLGMSGQISIASILASIQRARNRFIIDAEFPLSVSTVPSAVAPDGMVAFQQTSVLVHKASWQDQQSGVWTNLWREDAWSNDKNNSFWTLEPGLPVSYSESENAPLKIQLNPTPQNPGSLEVVTVDSLIIDTTQSGATFNIPDEWIHAVKYAVLADLFSSESQLNDPLRAQYCEMRYQQATDAVSDAHSIMRMLINNKPLATDALASVDAGFPYWRNQTGLPDVAGVMYDLVAFNRQPDQAYGVLADVVQSSPLPVAGGTGYMPIGAEDIQHMIDYAVHVLTLKCGGNEFKSTFPSYDSYMTAVADRGKMNIADIRYLSALFGQTQKDDAMRPDKARAK